MILSERPHLQGLVLGFSMLAAAALAAPAAVHAVVDATGSAPQPTSTTEDVAPRVLVATGKVLTAAAPTPKVP